MKVQIVCALIIIFVSNEVLVMIEIWELCRKLSNHERRALLRMVCNSKDGLNVGIAEEESNGLQQSGTSQYLGQLWKLGLIRRVRSGRYVNYYPDAENAHVLIQDVAVALQERFRSEDKDTTPNEDYLPVMRVMGHAMRAKVIGMLSREGTLSLDYLCDKTGLTAKSLARHLKPAIEIGLVEEIGDGSLKINTPADPIARLLIKAYS